MASQNAPKVSGSKFNFWLLFYDIAEHIECKVVEIELHPSSEHKATEDKSPYFMVVSDTGLKFSIKTILDAVPVTDGTPIVHYVDWLNY
jgi:hypothetical protein